MARGAAVAPVAPAAPASGSVLGLGVFLIVLAFTLASLFGVNPYAYGVGDNRITIPFLKAFADSRLYPGDFLIDQRVYYYTYLWNALGALHRTGVPLPGLFFTVYLAGLYATFLGIYLLARALFRKHEVGVIALILLLFAQNTLGGVATIEDVLSTRGLAVPILLFATLCFLNARTGWSFALLGVSYLIHPLTTHYVLAAIVVATLTRWGGEGVRRLVRGLPWFLALASPILWWRMHHAPESLNLLRADPRWLAAMHLRSAYHMFPFSWGPEVWVHAGAAFALFLVSMRNRPRESDALHATMRSIAAVIVTVCVLGIVFSEVWPLGIDFVMQPLRAFQFMEYLAMLYFANDLYQRCSRGKWRGYIGLVPLAATWFITGCVDRAHAGAAIAVLVCAGGIVCALERVPSRRALQGWAMTGIAMLACALIIARDFRDDDPGFSIENRQPAVWLELQRWAREHSDPRDAFIVPPDWRDSFRVEGERTVYAEWGDGGLMNANPAFGLEWRRRMLKLGHDRQEGSAAAYARLRAEDLRAIASEMRLEGRRVHVVWPVGAKVLGFPLEYRNEACGIYQVTP